MRIATRAAAIASACAALSLAAGPAFAAAPSPRALLPHIVTHFDFAAAQTPEDLAVEPDGSVDLSLARANAVVRVGWDGSVSTLAQFPAGGSCPLLNAPGVLGIARTFDGNLYVVRCTGDARNGVWRITPGQEPVQIAQLPTDGFPNDMAVDDCTGDLYLTDSLHGTVWRVPTDGRPAQQWASGPELQPQGFIGANGVAVHNGAVWVGNSSTGNVLRIPIQPDGSAGPIAVAAGGIAGVVDNIDVVGPDDTIIATLVSGNEVVTVRPGGTAQPLLTAADGLQNPVAAEVVGGRIYVADSAYITNKDPNLLEAVYVP